MHEFYMESKVLQLAYLVSIPVFNSWWRWKEVFYIIIN